MKTSEVRSSFLEFFKTRQHQVVASDSLIPATDPTLLFTSAGMVQFKPNFQNPAVSPFRRATSSQKCLRTSDIDRVGQTLRHLTFFEMLGNFSFGDYFKKESVAWGWEFLTQTMKLPKDRFIISVFKDDDEAFKIWEGFVPAKQIVRLGEDTNFWTMGPTGPCGPCSEILWDRGESWSCGKPTCGPACDCDRYLEVWNHVFTQFDRSADGKLTPLPQKNIDTGMGLERLTLLMQNANSPFGTDIFQDVLKRLSDLAGQSLVKESDSPKNPTPQISSARRIADHVRAVTFMIGDGVFPSNEGRGYILRRLIRQAVRAGKTLSISKPFLYQLSGAIVDAMQATYPELSQRRALIAQFIQSEEEKFLETLDTGTRALESLVAHAKEQKQKTLVGDDLFKLYDTYGFPFELTKEMVQGLGFEVDEAGFHKAQDQATALARSAWKGSGSKDVQRFESWKAAIPKATVFRGYDHLELNAIVQKPLYKRQATGWAISEQLNAGEEGEIALDETPFYAERGGQVGDVGEIVFPGGKALVLDTQAPVNGLTVHRIRVESGSLSAGTKVTARVDGPKRQATMRNHTATHLVHSALREILGSHVTQAGSLVAPDRLRFDFTHYGPMKPEEIERVERLVNEKTLNDLLVKAYVVTKADAMNVGALAFFGEKYGDDVRCVMIPGLEWNKAKEAWSLELCGGTHCHATGEVGLFKILSEAAIGAGVRRLEAATGYLALSKFRSLESEIAKAAELLKANPDELNQRIQKLVAQEKQQTKEIERLRTASFKPQMDSSAEAQQTVDGITVYVQQLQDLPEKQLRIVADQIKDRLKPGVLVLAVVNEDKASFVVSMSQPALDKGGNAGALSKQLAALLQGSGGGRPDFAQGGGKDIQALTKTLADVPNFIKEQFKAKA